MFPALGFDPELRRRVAASLLPSIRRSPWESTDCYEAHQGAICEGFAGEPNKI